MFGGMVTEVEEVEEVEKLKSTTEETRAVGCDSLGSAVWIAAGCS
jgi:hypothetical protein